MNKQWKPLFDSVTRQYEMTKDEKLHKDFTGLYLKLERLSESLIKDKKMPIGSTYDIPLENGDTLRMQFSNRYPSLTVIAPDGKSQVLIPEDDVLHQEYPILNAYTFGNRACGIGHPAPDKLCALLQKELQPGRIISFEGIDRNNQYSVVCVNRVGNYCELKELFLGSFKNISASSFMNATSSQLYLSKDGIQEFYNKVKSRTGNVIPRCEDLDCFAQEKINALIKNLKKGKTAILSFGNERLRVQSNRFTGRLKWYDKNGTQITEEAAKVFLAWCHNAPTVVEVKSKNQTIAQEIKNHQFYRDYESAIIRHQYATAVQKAEEFCKQYQKDFSINVSTYQTKNAEATAVTYCFKSNQDVCELYKISYTDNDFTKDPSKIERVSTDEFIAFCHNKYDSITNALLFEAMEEYRDQLKTAPQTEHTKQNIIEQAAYHKTLKIVEDEELIKALDLTDIKPEINALIESYRRYPENEQPIIYDASIGISKDSAEEIQDYGLSR